MRKTLICLRGHARYDALDTASTFANKSLTSLCAESALFKLCSYDSITKASIALLRSDIIGTPFRYVFKKTAFRHFCGGESIDDCYGVVDKQFNDFEVKSILDHSTEEVLAADGLDINMKNKLELIECAAKHNNQRAKAPILFIPLKPTALIEPHILEIITNRIIKLGDGETMYDDNTILETLLPHERLSFTSAVERFTRICRSAYEKNLSLLLDAEQSYRQPAIELLYRQLAPQFNTAVSESASPTIYNTYQAYLHRTEGAVLRDLQHASDKGYVFAAKVVRGAYLNAEILRSKELGRSVPPTRGSKAETDEAYDRLVELLLRRQSRMKGAAGSGATGGGVSVLLATHNGASVGKAIGLMEELDIRRESQSVHFAQIKGMCDNVTNALGLAGYNSSKLITFGSFDNLLPWLLRRLEENQDCLAGMQQERHLLNKEIKRRLWHR